MRWNLWSKQIDAIVRLELKRYIRARRWVGMYLLALAPIVLLTMRAAAIETVDPGELTTSIAGVSDDCARFYQLFILRFGIFFCCAVIFSQFVRGEILEKTLHFYLLAPARRGVIITGKYVAGVVASAVLFGVCTIGTFILLYLPHPFFRSFFLGGNGIPDLARYMLVTILACIGYGSVFLLAGVLFKNPAIPTVTVLGWESLSFAFPAVLQNLSLVHHLQSLMPVTIDRGLFAVLTERPSPLISIPAILVMTAGIVALAGWMLNRAEVTYSSD